MGTKNIVSVEPNAEVTPLRVLSVLADDYEGAEVHRESTDKVENKSDHGILTIALADAIWERYVNWEVVGFISGSECNA